jgi:hypothetical protein
LRSPNPPRRIGGGKLLAVVCVGFLGFSGILVRLFTPNSALIVKAGVLLWVAGSVAYWLIFGRLRAEKQISLTRVVVTYLGWTMSYTFFYAISAAMTGVFLQR